MGLDDSLLTLGTRNKLGDNTTLTRTQDMMGLDGYGGMATTTMTLDPFVFISHLTYSQT